MQRYAVIVDPLGTGQEYAPTFRAAGVEPVAVLAALEVPEVYAASWHPENFEKILRYDGTNLAGLAAVLAPLRPLCVIAGAETGVELADALCPLVAPDTANEPSLAAARRDKWAMAEAVRSAGIPHLRQVCSDDPAVIAQWLREEALEDARLVLKPPKSGGTDDVHLVLPGGDWKAVFDQIIGRVNKTGVRNDAVLVEEFAEGAEFLIDGYSVDGRHGLVDVCRYTKGTRGDRIGIYDRVDFLPPDHPDVRAVWPYARQVLDAVGIRNGCSHTFISAPNAGIFRNEEVFDGVEKLPTYWAKNFPFHNGDHVAATEDIFTYLAWVILSSADPDAVETDYRWVRERERQVRIDPAG